MQQQRIVKIGWSHKNAPVEFRDRIALSEDAGVQFMKAGVHRNTVIKELAVVSTCIRTEFYSVTTEPSEVKHRLFELYHELADLEIGNDDPEPEILFDEEAAQHLMMVAAGLESMMLGEAQILSQIKLAYDLCLSSGNRSPILNRLFQEAIRAGKQVREKTTLGEGAVSISMAAAELSRKIFKNFEDKHILIIGAGETSELVAWHFQNMGGRSFTIANRGEERRIALAEKVNGEPVSLDEIPVALLKADIVVAATGSQEYLITHDSMHQIMRSRKYRTLFMVDISTPRNIDPDITKVDSVFLFDIDHLEDVISENLKKRKAQIPAAERIIKEILGDFNDWMKTLDVVPTIAELSKFFNAIRKQELTKYVHKADEKEYSRLEELSKSLVRKLLHNPIMFLRGMTDKNKIDIASIASIREMYDLKDFQNDSDQEKKE